MFINVDIFWFCIPLLDAPKEDHRQIDYTSKATITSADKLNYTLLSSPIKGELLHIFITAVDVKGNRQTDGGDLWFITAKSDADSFYTSGHVFDHHNGSYSAYILSGWSDNITLSIKLAYSSHTTNFLESVWTNPTRPQIYWKAHFVRGNITGYARCYIATQGWDDTAVCAYPRPDAMGNRTAFVCDKPAEKELSCDSLKDYVIDKRKTKRAHEEITEGHMWKFNGWERLCSLQKVLNTWEMCPRCVQLICGLFK